MGERFILPPFGDTIVSIVKYFLCSAIIIVLITKSSFAQRTNELTYEVGFVGAQLTQAFKRGPFSELSLSGGIRHWYGELSIGATARYILNDIDHTRMHYGFHVAVQLNMLYPFVFTLKDVCLFGKTYQVNHFPGPFGMVDNTGVIEPRDDKNHYFTLSAGRAVTDKTVVAIGISNFRYDPERYETNNEWPFSMKVRIVLSITHSFVLGKM